MKQLDGHDLKLWAAAFGVALTAVITAYLVAYRFALPGFSFSGLFHDSHDGYSYWAWSEAFRRGGLLVDNPYSTIPFKPQYFNLVWFVLGKTMKYTGLSYLPVYYLFGILAGGAMYLAILAFMRQIIGDRAPAWFAFLLAGFGSGFGWIAVLVSPLVKLKIFPSDLYGGDSFPFFSFLSFPHLSFSFFLLTMIYLWMYRATVLGRRRWSLGAGFLILLLGFSHPYHLVSVLAVIGVWYLVLTARHGKKWLGHWIDFLILAVGALPPLAYFWYLFSANPNFTSWAAQNVVTSKGFGSVVAGLGPFLLLAIPGIWSLFSRRTLDDRHLLMIIWPAVNFALLFSYPFIKFGGRLIQGIILPLAILSSWGFFGVILPRVGRAPRADGGPVDIAHRTKGSPSTARKPDLRFLWAIPILLLTLPSYGFVIANQLSSICRGKVLFPVTWNTQVIIPQKLARALDYAAHNMKGSNVLSATGDGLILPVFAEVRSFVGHVGITPLYDLKAGLAKRFYDSRSSEAERMVMLSAWNIDFVWRGPFELGLGGYDPSKSKFLWKVYGVEDLGIYRVDRRAMGQGSGIPRPPERGAGQEMMPR